MRRFLWKASHCSRVRVPLLLAVGAGLLAAPTAGAGGQAGFGCAPGFELGANTVAQALLLPRIQAGLASGFGDVAGFTAFFNATDKNGDGVLCIKAPPEGNNPSVPGIWQYQYSFVDDNSSATTG